jgi:hypothetical protein
MTPEAQARISIIADEINSRIAIERGDKALAAIKLETRWLVISAPARDHEIDDSFYAEDRAQLVKLWPHIRHQRLPRTWLNSFFADLVAAQASAFAHLIEIRHQRRRARCGA